MKFQRAFYLSLFLCLSGSAAGFAAMDSSINAQGSLGLGVELGQPVGASGKFWLSNLAAVDAGLGYHFNSNFSMHTDFLLHSYALGQIGEGWLPLYAGLGARVLAGDDAQFDLRFPFGVAYLLKPNHVELFAEIAPILDVSNIGFDIDGLVGVRLYAF